MQVFIFVFSTLSAGFLIWNYYVTMPMPASTFTLAVGHWQQVTAEIPPQSGEGVGEQADRGQTAKLGAGPARWTQAELVSGLGCSSGKGVGSALYNNRYFINFPIDFFSSQFNLAPPIFHRKPFFFFFLNGVMDKGQHSAKFYDKCF